MHFLVFPPVLDLSSLVSDIRGAPAERALLLPVPVVVVVLTSVPVTGFLSSVTGFFVSVTGFFSSTVPLLSLLDKLNLRVTAVAARERRIPIVGFWGVLSNGSCWILGSGSADFSGSGRAVFSSVGILDLGLMVVVEEVAYL